MQPVFHKTSYLSLTLAHQLLIVNIGCGEYAASWELTAIDTKADCARSRGSRQHRADSGRLDGSTRPASLGRPERVRVSHIVSCVLP